MARVGRCPICKRVVQLTRHHKWRQAVWKKMWWTQGKIILICRDCHDELEKEITRRENKVLQQHPEIYSGTLEDFIRGRIRTNVRIKNASSTVQKDILCRA